MNSYNIEPKFKGNIGMFLVCAELSKRNLIAMPTSRNTKGYDVVVLNPESNKSVGLQVKCTDKKDFPIMNSHWCDYEQQIKGKILCDFIFVDIAAVNVPQYFILSVEEMKDTLTSSIWEYALRYQQKNNLDWAGMLRVEKEQKRKPNLWTLKLSQIDKFKDNWRTIINKL